jgi:ribosomal-protein-alanine N-acetyltransferase
MPSLPQDVFLLLNSNLGGPLLWAAIVTKRLELKTQRLVLRLGTQADIPAIVQYYQVNRAYLEPFEPQRPTNFFTHEFWKTVLVLGRVTSYGLRGENADDSTQLTLSSYWHINLIHRKMGWSLQWGHYLGYSLTPSTGQGLHDRSKANGLIAFAFDELNRTAYANYMPHNHRSANVLKRLGLPNRGHSLEIFVLINASGKTRDDAAWSTPNWQMPEL